MSLHLKSHIYIYRSRVFVPFKSITNEDETFLVIFSEERDN